MGAIVAKFQDHNNFVKFARILESPSLTIEQYQNYTKLKWQMTPERQEKIFEILVNYVALGKHILFQKLYMTLRETFTDDNIRTITYVTRHYPVTSIFWFHYHNSPNHQPSIDLEEQYTIYTLLGTKLHREIYDVITKHKTITQQIHQWHRIKTKLREGGKIFRWIIEDRVRNAFRWFMTITLVDYYLKQLGVSVDYIIPYKLPNNLFFQQVMDNYSEKESGEDLGILYRYIRYTAQLTGRENTEAMLYFAKHGRYRLCQLIMYISEFDHEETLDFNIHPGKWVTAALEGGNLEVCRLIYTFTSQSPIWTLPMALIYRNSNIILWLWNNNKITVKDLAIIYNYCTINNTINEYQKTIEMIQNLVLRSRLPNRHSIIYDERCKDLQKLDCVFYSVDLIIKDLVSFDIFYNLMHKECPMWMHSELYDHNIFAVLSSF